MGALLKGLCNEESLTDTIGVQTRSVKDSR
jgi:hypothetical protein